MPKRTPRRLKNLRKLSMPMVRYVRSLRRLRYQRWMLWAMLGVIGMMIWWLRAPMHALPLERDEGAYAVIARDWLAGALPYRDRFDHKPPFTYIAYMPTRLMADDIVLGIRRWATFWLMATCLAAWWTARRLWRSEAAGVIAALLMGAWGSGMMVQGMTFNTEAIMLLPAMLSLGFALKGLDTTAKRWWIAAGACAALALLSKPVAILIIPAVLVGSILVAGTLADRLGRLTMVFDGLALVIVPMLLYFALAGGWNALFEALWTYNVSYANESFADTKPFIATLLPVWKPLFWLVAIALLGLSVVIRRRRYWASVGVASLWTLGLIAGAILSRRPYPHYYLAAVGGLVILAGGIAKLQLKRFAIYKPAIMLTVALLLCIPPYLSLREMRQAAPEQQSEILYGNDGRMMFALAPKVVTWVQRNVGVQARVWVWASEPQVYLLGDWQVPTRFPYDYPLDVLPNARDQVVATIIANPPDVLITYANVRPLGFDNVLANQMYYRRVQLGGYDIWTK